MKQRANKNNMVRVKRESGCFPLNFLEDVKKTVKKKGWGTEKGNASIHISKKSDIKIECCIPEKVSKTRI